MGQGENNHYKTFSGVLPVALELLVYRASHRRHRAVLRGAGYRTIEGCGPVLLQTGGVWLFQDQEDGPPRIGLAW